MVVPEKKTRGRFVEKVVESSQRVVQTILAKGSGLDLAVLDLFNNSYLPVVSFGETSVEYIVEFCEV